MNILNGTFPHCPNIQNQVIENDFSRKVIGCIYQGMAPMMVLGVLVISNALL